MVSLNDLFHPVLMYGLQLGKGSPFGTNDFEFWKNIYFKRSLNYDVREKYEPLIISNFHHL